MASLADILSRAFLTLLFSDKLLWLSTPTDVESQLSVLEKIQLNFLYFSFNPEIKWFQNEETVTVKVKIAGVADCKCEFSEKKVVFR